MSNDEMPKLTSPEMIEVDTKINEIIKSYIRISAERDLINDVKDDIYTTYKIPKKKVKQIADIRYKGNGDELREQTEEVIEFEEILRENSKNNM